MAMQLTVVLCVCLASLGHAAGFQGAVVSDADQCAGLASEIIKAKGSAVDVVITAMLCNGLVQSEASGLGGGGFMVIHLSNGSNYAINFRETAPKAATRDMFIQEPAKGGLAVGVPGELKAMEEAHKLFGRLRWSEVVQPVINLCEAGFKLNEHTVIALNSMWETDELPENFHKLYGNEDGTMKKVGDLIYNTALCETLTAIRDEGASALYEGKIAQSIVDTVDNEQGLSLEDLKDYFVRVTDPLQVKFNGDTFISPPSPSGGPVFLFMLALLDHYNNNAMDSLAAAEDQGLVYHRLVEAFKFGFAARTWLGDPDCGTIECKQAKLYQELLLHQEHIDRIFRKIDDSTTYNDTEYYEPLTGTSEADSGTSQITVLTPDGDAVSVTMTVNHWFGAKLMTDTGIVLNDQMDEFSIPNTDSSNGLPPIYANMVFPGKRPLSSTCPTIGLSDTGQVHMVLGGAGGTRIPTSVVQVLVGILTFKKSISQAIETRRIHDQLWPNQVYYESGFPSEILDELLKKHHTVEKDTSLAQVQGILVNSGKWSWVTAHSDSRRSGQAVECIHLIGLYYCYDV